MNLKTYLQIISLRGYNNCMHMYEINYNEYL